MKPLQERLNDRLEPAQSRTWQNGQRQIGFILPEPGLEHDQEIDELVVLARRLQAAPQLQVDPDFAWQLERRMLRRHT
jgi:IS4 transposase